MNGTAHNPFPQDKISQRAQLFDSIFFNMIFPLFGIVKR
jgi:hypothetical protein